MKDRGDFVNSADYVYQDTNKLVVKYFDKNKNSFTVIQTKNKIQITRDVDYTHE